MRKKTVKKIKARARADWESGSLQADFIKTVQHGPHFRPFKCYFRRLKKAYNRHGKDILKPEYPGQGVINADQ